jgi:hypothetical protein
VFAEGQNNGVTVVFRIDRSTGMRHEDQRHARYAGARLHRIRVGDEHFIWRGPATTE